METKRHYVSPQLGTEIIKLEDICEEIHQSGPSDDFAKENNLTFDDWDDDTVFKDLWSDDEGEDNENWPL